MDDEQRGKERKSTLTPELQRARQEELEEFHRMSIIEILREWGHEPVRTIGNRAFYLSPLREERAASFVVYQKEGEEDWYDFGMGKGGSIIDLVMLYWEFSYIEAIRMLRKRLYIPFRQPAESLK